MKLQNSKRTDDRFVEIVIHRMKQLRADHNYTQEYVIENTNLNIAQFEMGIRVPSLISLVILCKFYNITIEEFFAGTDYPTKK